MDEPIKCIRCGSDLSEVQKLCSDITCPFSDYVQSDSRGWEGHPHQSFYKNLGNQTDESIEASKEYIVTDDIIIQNFYPDSDTINIIQTDNSWNITVSRDENSEVHILVADNKDGTQINLILGQDGYTQKC